MKISAGPYFKMSKYELKIVGFVGHNLKIVIEEEMLVPLDDLISCFVKQADHIILKIKTEAVKCIVNLAAKKRIIFSELPDLAKAGSHMELTDKALEQVFSAIQKEHGTFQSTMLDFIVRNSSITIGLDAKACLEKVRKA